MTKRVLVAMSGGVDSSVTAALLLDQGYEVVGATMKLWGGASDSGCCSVADVDDARRVAQQLGIKHQVFNFGEEFMESVVGPYVDSHAEGRTPNPCIECNRHIKFDVYLQRAAELGFDLIATGHHARIEPRENRYALLRGADHAKDQSYVLHMMNQDALAKTLLPVGHMHKTEVREIAAKRGLRTASKPDSQDVCFITSKGGRQAFLGDRIPMKPARLVDHSSGAELGTLPSVEMVTVGQRKGMGGSTLERRYATEVDVVTGVVKVGNARDLLVDRVEVTNFTFTSETVDQGSAVDIQVSAHGDPISGSFHGTHVAFDEPQRRVARGQSVVLYNGDEVLGGGIAL